MNTPESTIEDLKSRLENAVNVVRAALQAGRLDGVMREAARYVVRTHPGSCPNCDGLGGWLSVTGHVTIGCAMCSGLGVVRADSQSAKGEK